jgi:hypothetical protein
MVFDVEPRQPATSAVAFVLASVTDPEWFESHGLLTAGIATPTEDALVSRPGACTSNGWAPCHTAVPVDSKQKYYSVSDNLTARIDFTASTPATLRQTVGGVLAIASTNTNLSATDIIVGDLYCTLDVELCEFSTAVILPVVLDSEKKMKGSRK